MAILKKTKGSTLMETLVATVIIIIIFMLSSMILNNVFSNTVKNNTRSIEAHLNELQYLQQHGKLQLPYQEVFGQWNVSVGKYSKNNSNTIEFEAINTKTSKILVIESEERK